jgi:hypothetical protein
MGIMIYYMVKFSKFAYIVGIVTTEGQYAECRRKNIRCLQFIAIIKNLAFQKTK